MRITLLQNDFAEHRHCRSGVYSRHSCDSRVLLKRKAKTEMKRAEILEGTRIRIDAVIETNRTDR